MTAALLASPLSAQPRPASAARKGAVGAVRFPLSLNPFITLCLFLVLRNGCLKTVVHNGAPAIVLDQYKGLRRVLTVDLAEDGEDPLELFRRDRAGKTLRAPCWTGTPRPSGYRTVRLKTQFPSLAYLIKLCRDFGYTWDAASAALPQAHTPWTRPHSDKRRNICTNLSDVEGDADSHGDPREPDYFRQSSRQEYSDPHHPYVPAAPGRRKKVGGGFTRIQVVKAIENHGWDTETGYALYEIFFKGKSTKEAATERGLSVTTLYQYASIVRGDIRGG